MAAREKRQGRRRWRLASPGPGPVEGAAPQALPRAGEAPRRWWPARRAGGSGWSARGRPRWTRRRANRAGATSAAGRRPVPWPPVARAPQQPE